MITNVLYGVGGSLFPAGALASKDRKITSHAPQVLFLHSAGGSPGQWAPQMAVLEGEGQAWSLPGHPGGPALPADAPSVEALATALLPQLDAHPAKSLLLVGHSAGASIAIALADLRPPKVAGLLLADPVGDIRAVPPEESEAFLTALRSTAYEETIRGYWSSILEGATAGTRTQVLADLEHTPKATMIYTLDALGRFDPVTSLRRFKGPVVSVTSPLNAEAYSLHRLLPSIGHVPLRNASHWVQLDAPAAFNQAVAAARRSAG